MDPHANQLPAIGLPSPMTDAPASHDPVPAPLPPIPATPPPDDRSDELDQEWVSKAKAIVERTKNDPFTESKELEKVKADYLKIRYNKAMKVAEDS